MWERVTYVWVAQISLSPDTGNKVSGIFAAAIRISRKVLLNVNKTTLATTTTTKIIII